MHILYTVSEDRQTLKEMIVLIVTTFCTTQVKKKSVLRIMVHFVYSFVSRVMS